MRRPFLLASLALLLAGPGCLIDAGIAPVFESNVVAATHYVHRGMVQNERGVAQADLNVDLATTSDGTIGLKAWGNLDLSDQTGNAWFPSDHGGKFTEVDLTAQYGQRLAGFDMTAGVQSYVLPNGLEFPNGERGNTTEFFGRVGKESFLGLYPQLELRLDWDEADGWYAHASVARDFAFEFEPRLRAQLLVGQGYSERDESDWNYGLEESGLADLVGQATLFFDWDDHTTFHVALAGSKLIDADLARWSRALGIDDDLLWLTAGMTFRY